ncbi:MAG: hypothetical protein B6244_10455 [Candidatus Cloacimonetes bacterium 4572_55]|nr:MAG: hypothetical protein B6244_10455 [Candidatus Cloacimonetes bacterium 4572_55]
MKKARFVITEKFSHSPAEVDVTPVMNLFCILIPFLLLTAVFAQTVVIDITLPKEGVGQPAQLQQESLPDMLKFVMINISENKIQIATNKRIYPPIPIKDWENDVGLSKFERHLQDIVAEYPKQKDVVLISPDKTTYATLIRLMDICIATGLGNISLSGPQRGESVSQSPPNKP